MNIGATLTVGSGVYKLHAIHNSLIHSGEGLTLKMSVLN